jgi:hypothetical protein
MNYYVIGKVFVTMGVILVGFTSLFVISVIGILLSDWIECKFPKLLNILKTVLGYSILLFVLIFLFAVVWSIL